MSGLLPAEKREFIAAPLPELEYSAVCAAPGCPWREGGDSGLLFVGAGMWAGLPPGAPALGPANSRFMEWTAGTGRRELSCGGGNPGWAP